MQKYEVIRPWFGVVVGDTVDFENGVPKALKAHVRPISLRSENLDPATPNLDPATPPKTDLDIPPSLDPVTPPSALNKEEIVKQLKKLKIEFDDKKSAEELATLLPANS